MADLTAHTLEKIDQLINESNSYHKLIDAQDWPALESALSNRHDKLVKLFQENPSLADSALAKEKIRKILSIDVNSMTAMQKQRDLSGQKIDKLKRNAESVKHYIDINQQKF